ncbi:hypothetical protein [Alicycliphilus denitrificans]|uniref:Hemerythrin-like domain-containing protein n=1 Tax=Alicycliphilus denitrificans TaxID=179636 RepID=A0A3R7LEN5_9BURK|nr:hypothetical protein [Alicycliphilus denitrificans]RKJ95570.1 hypothetical protein CE154_016690 [Alicycliphilus denitrificans]
MATTHSPAYFEDQHERLDAQLQAHLLDVVGADFGAALERLQRWRADLARHIEIENTRLLPHVPQGARWAARVYLLEHERIALLADEYAQRVQAAAAHPPRDEAARRRAVLQLLDSAHALRHVLEHHHEREHQGLARELPLDLQAAVWGGLRDGGA